MCTSQSTIETKIDPRSAARKFATVNPVTKYAATQNKSAFNTIPNNPKVRILIGSVRRVRTGLTIRLISPSTNPAISATVHDTTEIPGIRCVARTTVADNINHLKMILIINMRVEPRQGVLV